jgi:nucleoside-diphosphate-sugar epimerase
MRILVTGNMGYVGPCVIAHLRSRYPTAELIGLDSGLFASCLTTQGPAPETLLDSQRFADVRDVTVDELRGIDVVVHLAAISNDPIGNRFEEVTDAVNRSASLRLAECARDAGVQHFVFASSCSVYGLADAQARRETDPTGPLTAYARSKVGTEDGLRQTDPKGMTVTCLRFATACGFSERLRLDLVLNDFVACALTSGRVSVLSDGTPWRPLIDVADMARAIDWASSRDPARGGRMLVVNVGSDERNHQVRDLAQAVAQAVPGTSIEINTAAVPDSRSYRVDFSLFRNLAPEHQPRFNLSASIAGLVKGLRGIGFADPEFRSSPRMVRLNMISSLLASRRLSPGLRWVSRAA